MSVCVCTRLLILCFRVYISDHNVVTFSTPPPLHQSSGDKLPTVPPGSVYFVEDDLYRTWRHVVGRDGQLTMELVDEPPPPMTCAWFVLMLTLFLLPYAVALFSITLYFMLDDPLVEVSVHTWRAHTYTHTHTHTHTQACVYC